MLDKTFYANTTVLYSGFDKNKCSTTSFKVYISNADMWPATGKSGGARSIAIGISDYNNATGVITLSGSMHLTSDGASFGTGGTLTYCVIKIS